MRKQVPLLGEMTATNRQSIDETTISDHEAGIRYVNGYFESYKDSIEVTDRVNFVKRPGISGVVAVTPSGLVGSNPACIDGFIHSESDNICLLWTQTTAPSIQLSVGTVVIAAPAGWGNYSRGYLTEMNYTNSTYLLAVTNCVNSGGVSNGVTWTRITDADYAAGPVANSNASQFVDLDGYLFQANHSTCDIWNSDLNAPLAWVATSSIRASLYPGNGRKLMRLGKYIVYFKTNSIEFFENAGNASPGSPLGALKNLAKHVGVAHPDYIQEVNDGIIFIGKFDAYWSVYKLFSESLELRRISNQYIDAMLTGTSNINNAHDTPAGVARSPGGTQANDGEHKIGCGVLPYSGHEFYVIPYERFSMVYDNLNSTWMLWSYDPSNNGTQVPFRFTFAITAVSLGRTYINHDSYRNTSEPPKLLTPATGVDVSPTLGGANTNITFKWISPRLDFGSTRRKYMSFLEVLYTCTGALNSGTLTMSYWDDDKGTESSDVSRTTTATGARLVWRRLGTFRRRRFVFTSTSAQPIRLQAIEVDLDAAEDDLD